MTDGRISDVYVNYSQTGFTQSRLFGIDIVQVLFSWYEIKQKAIDVTPYDSPFHYLRSAGVDQMLYVCLYLGGSSRRPSATTNRRNQ